CLWRGSVLRVSKVQAHSRRFRVAGRGFGRTRISDAWCFLGRRSRGLGKIRPPRATSLSLARLQRLFSKDCRSGFFSPGLARAKENESGDARRTPKRPPPGTGHTLPPPALTTLPLRQTVQYNAQGRTVQGDARRATPVRAAAGIRPPMADPDLCVIVNPKAGRRRAAGRLAQLRRGWGRHATFWETRGPGDAE